MMVTRKYDHQLFKSWQQGAFARLNLRNQSCADA